MAVTNYYTVNGQILGERPVSGSRTNYAPDALGSVVATISGAALQNTYAFKPFGAQLQKTGASPDPAFTWGGSQGYLETNRQYSDKYVRARSYAAAASRWSTRD